MMNNRAGRCTCSTLVKLTKIIHALWMNLVSSGDHIDELLWNDNHPHNLATVGRRLDLLIGERSVTQIVLAGIGAGEDAAAQLAVHLHRDFDLFFTRKLSAE